MVSCAIAGVVALSVIAMMMPLKHLYVDQSKWLKAQQAGQASTMIIMQRCRHGRLLPSSDHRLVLDIHGRHIDIFVRNDSLYLQFDHKKPEGWVHGVTALSLKYDGLPATEVVNWAKVCGIEVDLTLIDKLSWSFYVAL